MKKQTSNLILHKTLKYARFLSLAFVFIVALLGISSNKAYAINNLTFTISPSTAFVGEPVYVVAKYGNTDVITNPFAICGSGGQPTNDFVYDNTVTSIKFKCVYTTIGTKTISVGGANGTTPTGSGTVNIVSAPASGSIPSIPSDAIIFNNSGTWTAPADVTRVQVWAWGGGGAGARADQNNNDPGSGGGGGGFAGGEIAVTPGTTYNIVVGKGGVGQEVVYLTNYSSGVASFRGKSGENSSFGNLVGARGGEGGGNFSSTPALDIGYGGGGIGPIVARGINGAPSTFAGNDPQNFGIPMFTGGNGGFGGGSLGGSGGSINKAGTAPGGGGGANQFGESDGGIVYKGGDGRVVIAPIIPPFDFSLANGGDKTATANVNTVVTNTITTTSLSPKTSGDVSLTVDSILDSAGINVKNTTTGISAGSNALSKQFVSLSPTNVSEGVTLNLGVSASTLPGVYKVNVLGKYEKINVSTNTGTPPTYNCYIVWETVAGGNNQYDGFYFGCSTNSGFNPKVDFESNGAYFSTKCINFDEGNCKTVGQNSYPLNSQGALKVASFRRTLADRECGVNNYTITGNEQNASAYFKCNTVVNTTQTNSTLLKSHTTSYFVTVQKTFDYGLTLTAGPDGCKDFYIKNVWNEFPGATSYVIYRIRGDVPSEVSKILVSSSMFQSSAGKITFYDKSFTAYNTLYKYRVAAVISGAEQASSPEVSVFSPKYICELKVGQIKLFTKATADLNTNLNSYTFFTLVSPLNSELVLRKGSMFDLKWVSDTNMTPDYICVQKTVLPDGVTINNTLWNYGDSANGTVVGLKTDTLSDSPNPYKLQVVCTGSGNTASSNIVKVTVQPKIDYKFQVSLSGDQCIDNDLWIKQSWGPVTGATLYRVYRKNLYTGESLVYNIAPPSTTNTETNTLFSIQTKYEYKVAAIIGGIEQLPSPSVIIISPKKDCPPPPVVKTMKMFVKKSTDKNTDLNAYSLSTAVLTTNTAITIYRDEDFDLRWISDIKASDNYTCSPSIVKPDGVQDNTVWSFGNSANGSNYGIKTYGLATSIKPYILKVDCVSGGTHVISNDVKVTILTPVVTIDYGFKVSPSSSACKSSDLYIRSNWNPVTNANYYKITRTRTGSSEKKEYSALVGTENKEYSSQFTTGAEYTYRISAYVNGIEQPASLLITITAPSIKPLSECPPSSSDMTLKIRSWNDPNLDAALADQATVPKGDGFRLKWATTNAVASDYSCGNTIITPNGNSSANLIWPASQWGPTATSLSGDSYKLETTSGAVVTGTYLFSIHCDNKTAGGPSLDSNIVSLLVTSPSVVDLSGTCSTSDSSVTSGNPLTVGAIATGGTGNYKYRFSSDGGVTYSAYSNSASIDYNPTTDSTYFAKIQSGTQETGPISCGKVTVTTSEGKFIKLFLGNPSILESTITDKPKYTDIKDPYKINRNGTFNIKWFKSNIDNSYNCTSHTTAKTGSGRDDYWDWFTDNSNVVGTAPNLRGEGDGGDSVSGIYEFYISCKKGSEPALNSNYTYLRISDSIIEEI